MTSLVQEVSGLLHMAQSLMQLSMRAGAAARCGAGCAHGHGTHGCNGACCAAAGSQASACTQAAACTAAIPTISGSPAVLPCCWPATKGRPAAAAGWSERAGQAAAAEHLCARGSRCSGLSEPGVKPLQAGQPAGRQPGLCSTRCALLVPAGPAISHRCTEQYGACQWQLHCASMQLGLGRPGRRQFFALRSVHLEQTSMSRHVLSVQQDSCYT